MSNIALLPIYRFTGGVETDEDWSLTLQLTLADGATPIDLTGIAFTASLWNSPTSAFTVAGTISGGSNNILTFLAPAAAKVSWPTGSFPLTILAVDGAGAKRDLLGRSTLTVGAPQIATLTPLLGGGAASANLISGLSPAALAAALASLSSPALAPLRTAMAAAASGANSDITSLIQSLNALLQINIASGQTTRAFNSVSNGPTAPLAGLFSYNHLFGQISQPITGSGAPGTATSQEIDLLQAQLNVNTGFDGIEAKVGVFALNQASATYTNSDLVGLSPAVNINFHADGPTNSTNLFGSKAYGMSASSTVGASGWTPYLVGIEIDSAIHSGYVPTSISYDQPSGDITLDFAAPLPAGLTAPANGGGVNPLPQILSAVTGTGDVSYIEGQFRINAVGDAGSGYGSRIVLTGPPGRVMSGLAGGNISGVPFRAGINILNLGEYQAGDEAAICISNGTGKAAWFNGIMLSNQFGRTGVALDPQGSFLTADGGVTMKHWANFPGAVVNGFVLNFAHTTLAGDGTLITDGAIVSTPAAVAALGSAASAGVGARRFVTDATATTFASIVAGGGANKVPVYSDGANWRIG